MCRTLGALLCLAGSAAALRAGVPIRLRRGAAAPRVPAAAAAFRSGGDFAAFESEARAYLATLNATALSDPDFPSPLAYSELGDAGRADLAEGCMQFGGFLKVSERLGVRVRVMAPPPPSPPPRLAKAEDDSYAGDIAASSSAKELKLAAQLAEMAARGAAAAGGAAAASAPAGGGGGSRMRAGGSPLYQANEMVVDVPVEASAEPAAPGAARFFRLDGLQRANALLLVLLVAVGFGSVSEALLDASVAENARLGASVLGVAHAAIASYAAFIAVGAEDQPPAGWLFKCALTGAGGLAELRRELARAVQSE